MRVTKKALLLAAPICFLLATLSCEKFQVHETPSPQAEAAPSASYNSPPAVADLVDLVKAQQPADEAVFIAAIGDAQRKESDAKNDMQRGGVKAVRDTALCTLMSNLAVTNWTGKVTKVSANSDGRGVFYVEIANKISLKTWNNSISDSSDNTLMTPGSKAFNAASNMEEGALVRVSGSFIGTGDSTCIRESSMTLKGKLQDPEFIFKFHSVSLLSNSAPPMDEEPPTAKLSTKEIDSARANAILSDTSDDGSATPQK